VLDGGVSEEWFDVVDESDRVIGRERRRDVHRRGLLHRAVHVLVIDPAGRVFLQKRSMKKDSAPGVWDSSASGHVDSGEAYDACAVREVREELGWAPTSPLEPLFKLSACAETGREFVWVYRTRGEGPFVLHPDEIADGRWLAPGEIDAAIQETPADFAVSFRHVWTEVRRRRLVD
jgi:isopentenyl-diphosphate Delta-isomerase